MKTTSLLNSPAANSWQIALLVTFLFATFARLVKGVDWAGALAGALVSFLIYFSAGLGAFAGLVTLFVLTAVTTRIGYAHKRKLGTAEHKQGRSASQVIANVGVAATAAVIFKVTSHPVFLLASAAAMAEAAADTSSSEIGQAYSDYARLITNFTIVPAGTDGGITFTGTTAGAIASVIVAGVFHWLGLLTAPEMVLAAVSGFCGMLFDSILGSLLERRRVLNNDTVNFSGTLFASAIAIALSVFS